MFGLFTKLISKRRASKPANTARRVRPGLEYLEDRMVPTTLSALAVVSPVTAVAAASPVSAISPISVVSPASPASSVSLVRLNSASPAEGLTFATSLSGQTYLFETNAAGQIEVFDNGSLLSVVNNPSAINAVGIQVATNDTVIFDNTTSGPLLFPSGTIVNLSGSPGNSFTLEGNEVSGNEGFNEATSPTSVSTISVDGLAIQMAAGAFGTVTDTLPITGNFQVGASSQTVTLENGFNSSTQTLLMGSTTLTFADKPSVVLALSQPSTVGVVLAATSPEAAEQSFQVNMFNSGTELYIGGTPAGVTTNVAAFGNGESVELAANAGQVLVFLDGSNDTATVYNDQAAVQIFSEAPGSSDAIVNIDGNQAPVQINGNSTTAIAIGSTSTGGIGASIQVDGAASLSVNDSDGAPASVSIENGVISGVGLFGNNDVTISYSDVDSVAVVSPPSPAKIVSPGHTISTISTISTFDI